MQIDSMQIKERISQFFSREDGASALEYVLMAAMVAVVIATFSTGVKDGITATFNSIITAITPKA